MAVEASPLLRLGPGRKAFESTETTEHFVATVEIRIAAKDGSATRASDGALTVAERAAYAAQAAYAFFNAQVDSVTLVSIEPEDATE